MKKLAAVLLAFTLAALLPLTVFADLGEPVFDDWYLLCGMNGYDLEETIDPEENGETVLIREHIEPGTRYQVHSYDPDTREYLIVPEDDNYKPKGTGFITVTEDEMNRLFLDPTKVVKETTGKKLDKAVNCVVSSSAGVVLRQGPAKTFPKLLVVPSKAKLTYLYTYAYGGYNWGYTTYKDKDGWVCLDYTEAVTAAPTQAALTQAAPTTQDTLTQADQTAPAAQDAVETDAGVTAAQSAQSAPFFSNTSVVIIICCLGAVIIALCAVVILLIIKRKSS